MTGERLAGNVFVAGGELLKPNEIPSIAVYGETLPEAWETALLAVYEFGAHIPTEYDQSIDPESRDATMMITVASPFKEPRIHKALPCGLDDLFVYTQEVIAGVHDWKVGETGWSYSYHDRLFNWPGVKDLELRLPHIDQIEDLVQKLSQAPHSRRAQAITWFPPIDGRDNEPPCLQRIWCRVVNSGEDAYLLEMNTHWRSRDALKAAFMNMNALTELQAVIAGKISQFSGYQVGIGRYVDISDSFHIYGSYLRKGEMERFVRNVQSQPFERRVFRSDNPVVQKEFAKGREKLSAEACSGGLIK
jgi:thymidylate synthase